MRKPVCGVYDRAGNKKKQAVQSQKMPRGLNFRIKELEELYNLYSENKGADQLICAFVFAYTNAGFLMTRINFYACMAQLFV